MALSAANAPTGLLCEMMEHPEETVINDSNPEFGWIYQPSARGDSQAGFRLIVASSQTLADQAIGNVWDSGFVTNGSSVNVPYAGPSLQTNTDYFWRVQTLDGAGQISPLSASQHFRTDTQFGSSANAWANRYPIRFSNAAPVLVVNTAPKRWFIDFGQDAFAYATVHLNGSFSGQTVQARFGEMATGNAVNTSPPSGSSVRYGTNFFTLQNGDVVYTVRPPDKSGTTIDIRPIAGVVLPFRYFELTNFPGTLTTGDVVQKRLQYEFNDNASAFDSSSPALNQVWALCKYSMKATSFAGAYVDGDRERKPYEADAYINQLSHYAVDREFTLARYSQQYLLAHPTWPFEWKFHSILMAWADYLATGNSDFLVSNYDTLRTKLFIDRARSDGLIKGFPNNNQNVNDDIVDWPAVERDGYVIYTGSYSNFYSSVNNAFYYRCLQIMADAATIAGRPADNTLFSSNAAQVYTSYNAALWNSGTQAYIDGVGTTHSSAHANFFPLAFGLVPPANIPAVLNYLHAKAMAPSVYGAQYLLEGLFQNGDADYALGLMTTNGTRGWLNMLTMGSTITTEAWNFTAKPNMDWNHAWGAAAGNIIARFVLGLRPLTPGYGQVLIQPQLGQTLSCVQGTIPTIRGPVFIQATNDPTTCRLLVDIPGNVSATVMLPTLGAASPVALVDGNVVAGTISNGWLTVQSIGSGQHALWLSTSNAPSLDVLYSNWASSWFGTNAGNAALAGQSADPDGDGLSNYSEFIAATDPTDSHSTFKLDSITHSNNPLTLTLTLCGHAGRSYVLQRSPNLSLFPWTPISTNGVLPSDQLLILNDPQPPPTQSFYRVVVTKP